MIVDVNVSLSRWPFRRVPCDEPSRLVEKLRQYGVGQAWTGTLDGLFHRDLGAANARLAEECRRYGPGLLVPFGSVNPMLPDWREDVRRCREVHHMPGIRLHPNFHGYHLDEPVFAEVLAEAARHGLLVQLALRMDDVRVQHPLVKVPDVDPAPLAKVLAAVKTKLPLVILNSGRAIGALAALPNLYFECAMWESVGCAAALVEAVTPQRALFGSHLPLYSLESSLLKLRESALPAAQAAAIECENARRLMQLVQEPGAPAVAQRRP
jgi:predicted TIM-barrel fold metal-dependent hydrolase